MRRIALRHERHITAVVTALAILVPLSAAAQVGPIQQYGFLEYQYRLNQGSDIPRFSTQVGTWRTYASTWLWRPYILQLKGDLGLTRSRDVSGDITRKGASVTGGLYAQAFARSHFPLRVFFEKRDSRTEGGAIDRDSVRQAWGLNQSYSSARWGTYGLEYRRSDVDELFIDGIQDKRKTALKQWVFTALQSLNRNQFDFIGTKRNLLREQPMQMDDRLTMRLRHRFRSSSQFYLEDTTFFSDETITTDRSDRGRQLLQFNGRANWIPRTERALRVTGRMILRANETSAAESTATGSTGILSGAVVYSATRRLTLAANSTITKSMPGDGPDSSAVVQRFRATYRGDDMDLGNFRYYWSGAAGVGNTRQRSHGEDSVQDANGSFAHGLSRTVPMSAGRQLGFTLSQTFTGFGDTLDQRLWSVSHSISATLNRQQGRTSSYLRFLASDRRTTGTRENGFQLASLQASSRTQISRKRSWNGGITLQYSSNSSELTDEMSMASSAFSYSVNLSYFERDLFNKTNLNFESELQFLSSEFRNDDMFDRATEILDERESNVWRNSLSYRVGQLHMSLNADVSGVNDRVRSRIYFLIRRYYGSA